MRCVCVPPSELQCDGLFFGVPLTSVEELRKDSELLPSPTTKTQHLRIGVDWSIVSYQRQTWSQQYPCSDGPKEATGVFAFPMPPRAVLIQKTLSVTARAYTAAGNLVKTTSDIVRLNGNEASKSGVQTQEWCVLDVKKEDNVTRVEFEAATIMFPQKVATVDSDAATATDYFFPVQTAPDQAQLEVIEGIDDKPFSEWLAASKISDAEAAKAAQSPDETMALTRRIVSHIYAESSPGRITYDVGVETCKNFKANDVNTIFANRMKTHCFGFTSMFLGAYRKLLGPTAKYASLWCEEHTVAMIYLPGAGWLVVEPQGAVEQFWRNQSKRPFHQVVFVGLREKHVSVEGVGLPAVVRCDGRGGDHFVDGRQLWRGTWLWRDNVNLPGANFGLCASDRAMNAVGHTHGTAK